MEQNPDEWQKLLTGAIRPGPAIDDLLKLGLSPELSAQMILETVNKEACDKRELDKGKWFFRALIDSKISKALAFVTRRYLGHIPDVLKSIYKENIRMETAGKCMDDAAYESLDQFTKQADGVIYVCDHLCDGYDADWGNAHIWHPIGLAERLQKPFFTFTTSKECFNLGCAEREYLQGKATCKVTLY